MASNTSSTSSKDSTASDDAESDETKTSSHEKKLNESNLCPFKLEWAIGINAEVPLINLTTENRTVIAYACSHTVMLYNYKTKHTVPLYGHQNAVKTLSISSDGKWLMTADFEEDCVVVVWDTEKGTPICTLFNPHGKKELAAARISPNAKYIVTVGNEIRQTLNFWLWTYGRDKPDASLELSIHPSERVKEICFNEEFPEEFALMSDYTVSFFLWDTDHLKYTYPKILGKVRRFGVFNCSCYVPGTRRTLTATTNGYILVWNNNRERGGKRDTIEGIKHMKSVPLQKTSINVILQRDGMIVTGNADGRINFYDYQLRILYWCHNCGLDSIRSISFDLRSGLLGPVPTDSDSEPEIDEDDDDGEEGYQAQTETESSECQERMEYMRILDSMHQPENVSSVLSINIEHTFRDHNKKQSYRHHIAKPPHTATDATIEATPVDVGNFFVCTANGVIAIIEITKLKCHFISQHPIAPITASDVHPENDYVITGNIYGLLCLYDYDRRKLVVCKKTPCLPDCGPILDHQVKIDNAIYITCPSSHENLTAVTVVKYSPKCDMLVCGLENGALWLLHPVTLEPLDKIPYKHSTESILKVRFTECAEYMAYSDNTMVVAVFKKVHQSKWNNLYDFVGKYRAHYMPIRDILFGPPLPDNTAPRLFSLGEDQDLVEYDLGSSGTYPDPGLKILQTHRIEHTATPLCLSWYPPLGIESFLIISNSEYKYKLLNDITKMIRGTFLGPTFGAPVRHIEILKSRTLRNDSYMVFATVKEIGLQLLPMDGNPYKITGIVGHPRKITNISIGSDGKVLFTSGYNDPCLLMWKIKCTSVDVMARLGGEGLLPYYCLIEGGKEGWLINEMKDLFYYAQILHQGENTTATRMVSDKVVTKQIPNLMRAIGYYPSNEEMEVIMGEVSYKAYAETGQLVEEIKFEDFVKLYINHRPAFGHSMRELKEAFHTFVTLNQTQSVKNVDLVLTRKQFLNILFGKGPEGFAEENNKLFGEPITIQEAYMYLKLLTGTDEDEEFDLDITEKALTSADFNFLPKRISYKDFTTDIMGIELPEETRADNE